ncbi:MAG TPA: hypothetical protein VGN99_15505 [Steroidobacteraceae bacterium]|jgi:hypothetical protein|nr:hypothetical protein [Steroidobacteraceae bacterium]
MGYVKCWTAALLVLFIASCSSPPPPPKNNVFDPLTQQMDKARDVQKTVDEEAERARKAIDNQERGDSTR